MRGVDRDGQGDIWAASTRGGIAHVDPAAGVRDEYLPDHTIWDLASGPDGRTQLMAMPAQFKSNPIAETVSISGTWRTFDEMTFRLFYSNEMSDIALAAPPSMANIHSAVNENDTISTEELQSS